ncbi:MAG TPA: Fe-S cluster assembly protein HesB [Actinomycetota bacterium]
MTTLELPLVGPAGEPVDLARTIDSHGFSDLDPMRLDAAAYTLELTVSVEATQHGSRSTPQPRRIRISPGPGRTAHLEILGPRIGARAQAQVVAAARHVLRLDQDLSGFYDATAGDPDLAWVASGAGRMLQSPTAFEDVIKTVCTTNCSWSATRRMVNALVSELGTPALGGDGSSTNAFPTADSMANAPERFYRDEVRAGYRGVYLIELARRVADGEVDLDALAASSPADLSDDDLERTLIELPGIGPYAAAHIMMTMGRNSRLILDSWTRPTYAKLLGRSKPVADATIQRRFRRYGDHAGLAFWLFLTRDWVQD